MRMPVGDSQLPAWPLARSLSVGPSIDRSDRLFQTSFFLPIRRYVRRRPTDGAAGGGRERSATDRSMIDWMRAVRPSAVRSFICYCCPSVRLSVVGRASGGRPSVFLRFHRFTCSFIRVIRPSVARYVDAGPSKRPTCARILRPCVLALHANPRSASVGPLVSKPAAFVVDGHIFNRRNFAIL